MAWMELQSESGQESMPYSKRFAFVETFLWNVSPLPVGPPGDAPVARLYASSGRRLARAFAL